MGFFTTRRKLAGLGLIVLTIAALVLFTETVASAADTIGVVDWAALGPKHKNFASVTRQLQQISAQKQKEAMEAADKETDPAKKSEIVQTKLREVAQEEQRLLKPMMDDCEKAIRVIAQKQKLTIVLDKAAVHMGGKDITPDVIQELSR